MQRTDAHVGSSVWWRDARYDLRQRPVGNAPALDLLRSMAILMVFLTHLSTSFQLPMWIAKLPFIYSGWTGVDLFFILSGLLIGGQLWSELKRTGALDVRRFVLRRGFRIWPLYYSFVLFYGGWALVAHHRLSPPRLLADLFCVSNYFSGSVSGGWSLSTEEQFYILAPLVLAGLARLLPPRRLVLLPLVWFFMEPVVRWLQLRAAVGAAHGLVYPFHTHSDALALGLVLSWIMTFRPDETRPSWISNIAMLAMVFLAATSLRLLNGEVFKFSFWALTYAGITLAMLRAPRLPSLVGWHGFYVVSRLSYGVYLNHLLVLRWALPVLQKIFGHCSIGYLLCGVACLLLSLLVAAITFATIELPFLNLRGKWLAGLKAPIPKSGLSRSETVLEPIPTRS